MKKSTKKWIIAGVVILVILVCFRIWYLYHPLKKKEVVGTGKPKLPDNTKKPDIVPSVVSNEGVSIAGLGRIIV